MCELRAKHAPDSSGPAAARRLCRGGGRILAGSPLLVHREQNRSTVVDDNRADSRGFSHDPRPAAAARDVYRLDADIRYGTEWPEERSPRIAYRRRGYREGRRTRAQGRSYAFLRHVACRRVSTASDHGAAAARGSRRRHRDLLRYGPSWEEMTRRSQTDRVYSEEDVRTAQSAASQRPSAALGAREPSRSKCDGMTLYRRRKRRAQGDDEALKETALREERCALGESNERSGASLPGRVPRSAETGLFTPPREGSRRSRAKARFAVLSST